MYLQNTRATWLPLIRALLSGAVKVASWVQGVIQGSDHGTDRGTPSHPLKSQLIPILLFCGIWSVSSILTSNWSKLLAESGMEPEEYTCVRHSCGSGAQYAPLHSGDGKKNT